MLERHHKLALFMEGALGLDAGKMGYGVLRYSPNEVVCVIDSNHADENVQDVVETPRSCPVVASIHDAVRMGADALVLGIAPPGGRIPLEWLQMVEEAVEKELCVVNGLHDRLSLRFPNLAEHQWVWDVRVEPHDLEVATGKTRFLPNKRVLMIGTDMAVGKMTAGLELFKAARDAGINAEFVATGQIGIVVTGRGVALDAVRVDYASGALEREVMRASEADLVIVEGQGSLVHPGSTATLPLMRGSCPTHMILCHRAGQTALRRLPEIPIPPLREFIALYEALVTACGTFPTARVVAVALNTAGVGEDEAREWVLRTAEETSLPVTDPVRFGPKALLEAVKGWSEDCEG